MDHFQQCLQDCNWKEKSSTAPYKDHQPTIRKPTRSVEGISLTYLTTPPTISRKVRWPNHVLGVFGAFYKGCPPLTTFILISAIPTSFHALVKWVYMNPLCGRPFLTFNHRAPCVKAAYVRNSSWMQTEEKKCIPSTWFHWAFPWCRLEDIKKNTLTECKCNSRNTIYKTIVIYVVAHLQFRFSHIQIRLRD